MGAVVSKPDGQKDDLPLRMGAGQVESVERGIDDPDIAAPAPHVEQIFVAAGYPEHVAEGGEDHIGPACDRHGTVKGLQRGDAHRAARAMHKLDQVGQGAIDAELHQVVRLSAAYFHERPGPGDGAPNLLQQFSRRLRGPVLIEVFHGDPRCGSIPAVERL